MDDQAIAHIPASLPAIEHKTRALGFDMPSERQTGALLRTFSASKPGGHFLELGTGTGLATAWILDGMDAKAALTSIDVDPAPSAVATEYLGNDKRLEIIVDDAGKWLSSYAGAPFDLIFADAMPGKYIQFEDAWRNLAIGGFYVIDDMNPQQNWPDGHGEIVAQLLNDLDKRTDCQLVRQSWASGIVIAVRLPAK